MIYDRRKVVKHYRRELLSKVYSSVHYLVDLGLVVFTGIVVSICLDWISWQRSLQAILALMVASSLVGLAVLWIEHKAEKNIYQMLTDLEKRNFIPASDPEKRLYKITKLCAKVIALIIMGITPISRDLVVVVWEPEKAPVRTTLVSDPENGSTSSDSRERPAFLKLSFDKKCSVV